MTTWNEDLLSQYEARMAGKPRGRYLAPVLTVVSGIPTLTDAVKIGDRVAIPKRIDPSGCTIPKATGKYGGDVYGFAAQCRAAGIPEPVPEFVFSQRRWRFDYAWPIHKIAIEIDGGIWSQGRHTRGAGVLGDMEKMNAAAVLGWRLLRYAPQTIGQAFADLRTMLGLA